MASLTPSAYKQRDRDDGGPFLLLLPNDDDISVDVFFTDVAPEHRAPETPFALLLNVSPEQLTIWPRNFRPDRNDYLLSKYGSLERIVITQPYMNCSGLLNLAT